MNHVVKVQSRFNKNILTDFKVLSVEPPFKHDRINWSAGGVEVCSGFRLFINKEKNNKSTLWLWKEYEKPTSYTIENAITYQNYCKYLKDWNNAYKDIVVIDVTNGYLGEF